MLGCHLEAAAHMVQHYLTEIVPTAVGVGKEVAADTATNVDMFHSWHCHHSLIE